MRKRDNFYHKQKSGSNKDRCHFKQVKHLAQRKIKIAHEKYLADTLGVGCGDGFWGFFKETVQFIQKNSRQDNRGISTLKDSKNILHSGNVKKANLLNSQFQSDYFTLISA